jgi:D-erythronate 2-dehydrogenase
MNVAVTGAAGFLGSRLARELLAAGELGLAGGGTRPVSRITLIDQAAIPPDLAVDGRVTEVRGDLAAMANRVRGADVVFHLAAAVSAECEADFDLGIRANLRATEALLEACRAPRTNPVVVFASSVAVFGGSAEHPLPPVVDDDTLPNPQTSYGVQKVIGEQLLADYTRKGFVRGRSVRLMTVCVRPGRPNAAASGFLSSIIREPLAGRRARCPVDPETTVALASPVRAIAALLCAAASDDQAWGGRTAVTMPALTVSVAGMAVALERIAGPRVSALIDWVPDPAVAGIVSGWPARIDAVRATRLGLAPDPDFETVIRMHIGEAGRGSPGLADLVVPLGAGVGDEGLERFRVGASFPQPPTAARYRRAGLHSSAPGSSRGTPLARAALRSLLSSPVAASGRLANVHIAPGSTLTDG